MSEEIWKLVIGYEELYEISNLGRIKSFAKQYGTVFKKERLKTLKLNQGG